MSFARRVGWLVVWVGLTAFAGQALAEPSTPIESGESVAPVALADGFRSVWPTPFHDQIAWMMEIGLGGASLGEQFERVLDSGGVNMTVNWGVRMGYLSLEMPFQVQTFETPVLSGTAWMLLGMRSRVFLPMFDGGLRLFGGLGVHAAWATSCTQDGSHDCPQEPDEVDAFADYSGVAWETSVGISTPILSMWGDCSTCGCATCGCANPNCFTGGVEMSLALEYRRLWFEVENDSLSREMDGTMDAWLLTLSTEILFETPQKPPITSGLSAAIE